MNAVELAKAFAAKLRDALTQEEIELVNYRNRMESDANICHSHDFCDANQVMLDAMGEDFENSDEQNMLINEAWDIAKKDGFGADRT